MTPAEYSLAVAGFAEAKEREELAAWRRTRWLATHVVNVVRAAVGAGPVEPARLLPLPGDPKHEEAPRHMSKERFEFLKTIFERTRN